MKPATLPPLTTRTPTPRMVLPSANAPAETATWPNGVGVVKDYACPYAAIRDLARARADPLFGRIMPVLFRPFRFLRLPRPVVKDYACPFPGLWELRGLREVAVAHSAVVEGLGLSFARPRGGSCRIRGVLHARILRLPRPVVKDYACPFGVTYYACPFGCVNDARGGAAPRELRGLREVAVAHAAVVGSRIMPVLFRLRYGGAHVQTAAACLLLQETA